MSLTQEEIDKLSKNLSKIHNTNSEAKHLNDILKYIELLNNIDTDNIKPTVSIINSKSILRDDIESNNKNYNELLKCSKQKIISNNIAISNIMK